VGVTQPSLRSVCITTRTANGWNVPSDGGASRLSFAPPDLVLCLMVGYTTETRP
jgi:hypothetical protein